MKKQKLIFILFLIASVNLRAQTIEYFVLKNHEYRIQNPDSAIYYFNLIKKELSKKPNHFYAARAYNATSIAYYINGDLKKADSLMNIAGFYAKKNNNDTLQIFILNNSALYAQESGDLQKAFKYYYQALKIARKANLFVDMADTYTNIATLHNDIGQTDSAEINFKKGLIECEKEKIKIGSKNMSYADLHANLGLLYFYIGKFTLSYKEFFKSLKTYEKSKQWEKAATIAMNIGELYFEKKNYEKAKYYGFYSLKFNKKISMPLNLGTAYLLIGKTNYLLGQVDSSFYYLKKSEEIFRKNNNLIKLPSTLNSLAANLISEKKYDAAKIYLDSALAINLRIGMMGSAEVSYEIYSHLYSQLNDYKTAKIYIDKARDISDSNLNPNYYLTTQLYSSEIYYHLGKYREAFNFLKSHMQIKDSLKSTLDFRQQEEIEAIYQTEKKQKEIERQNAINEKKSLELKYSEEQSEAKSFQLKLGLIGSILIVIALIFVVRSNIQRKKINKLLAQKNDIIYKQKEEVEVQREELHTKNHIIEEKQKEILDSINYAKRIQYTLLANEELMRANLPNHFVFFQPKDIVSGDFYWATQKNNSFYLAICDSTGHGVPGAFMSLLNISFLNEAINEKNIEEPGKVLDYVRKKLIENISQDGGQDGMDGILIKIKANEISYAAAHNSPIILRGNEVIDCVYDKMPIGKSEKMEGFKTFNIFPEKGDLVYLFTDGYADQFGGEKGKKLKLKNMITILQTNKNLSLPEQKTFIENKFNEWKSDYEQVDDVLLCCIQF